MSWKCQECGLLNEKDSPRVCEGCGKADLGVLTLLVEATGKKLRMSVDTAVGRALLKPLAGDDARFASDAQFRVCKDEGRGVWIIHADASATNPTLLNGKPLAEDPAPLAAGHVLSIGSRKTAGAEKLRLVVCFEG
jgi:hypothetical protein